MTEHEHSDELDRELAAAGRGLRESTDPADGTVIMTSALRHQVTRARRATWVVAAVATLVVAASIGTVAAERSSRDRSEPPAGSTVPGAVDDPGGTRSAEEIVAGLPDEPIDPRSVELIAAVRTYDSCDALVDQLHEIGAAHVGSRGFDSTLGGWWGMGARSLAYSDGGYGNYALADEAAPATGGAIGETLGTNVIVEGVDEADSVKATDTLVVELSGAKLRVIDTTAAGIVGEIQLVEVSNQLSGATVNSLVVEGRRAVVFGSEWIASDPLPGDPSAARPTRQYLTLTFVDFTDPTAPTVTERIRLEGQLVAVRRVGGEIRMVTNSSLADLPIVVPTTPNAVGPALEQNRLAVAGSSVHDWIPDWDRGEDTESSALLGCGDVVVPETFAGVQMTSLVEFDLTGPFAPRAAGLLAPSENLTATATDVVVASHVWVDPVDRAEDFSDWSTALHRFSFSDGGPAYVASGAVDGSIRDEFSLSVLDEDSVGAVTVDVVPWASRSDAEVTVRVLATEGSTERLDEIGSLVPDEARTAVSGVRFIGDRLLVSSGLAGHVLSAVDLSDRAAPRELGNVNLPGSGSYLHPLGGNRVLAMGSTIRGEGEGLVTGMHATLLDLAAAPRIVDTWRADRVQSQALHDHHAFTWWGSRSLAAFGVEKYTNTSSLPSEAMFLTVQGDTVAPRTVRPREADLGPRCPRGQFDRSACDDTGHPMVLRVLVVNGDPWLYTSESLEGLDATSFGSRAVVALRR